MLEQLAHYSAPVLTMPAVRRTRRNHGLEHATIHILSRKRVHLSGRSDDSGFVLLGDVKTEDVEEAVSEALQRMKNGEHNLAIHPNCGTNLLTTGLLASLVGLIGLGGVSRRESFNRLPTVLLGMMAVILFSPLLGMELQRLFTTDGDPQDMEVLRIQRRQFHLPFRVAPVVLHRVSTRSS
ncbi:MAG: hypothetical protein H6672_01955 [Anaerolineaceae bacterium]|nr:hypothetical protein [Anaerolineaceae bacterium]